MRFPTRSFQAIHISSQSAIAHVLYTSIRILFWYKSMLEPPILHSSCSLDFCDISSPLRTITRNTTSKSNWLIKLPCMIVEPNRVLMHDQFLDRVGSTEGCRLQQKSVEYSQGGRCSVPRGQARRPGIVANHILETPPRRTTILILQHPQLLVATS